MTLKTLITGSLAALALGGAAMAQEAAEPVTAGFIYVGPRNDGGWSQHHHTSALEMKEHFGDAVTLLEQESVPEGPDAERAMTQMALSGADIIFTTSFGFMDPTINVAARFPNVKFEHATGYKTAENVSAYNARFYEGRTVTGYIAGAMTKTNKIGYIASFPIPEVMQGINSTFIHARQANPDVELTVIWVNTWFNPAEEANATQAMLDQGIDVVLAHTDSTAPLARLSDVGGEVYGFGQAADMIEYAPAPRLSSIIDNWAPYYIERVQAVMDGTWESENNWYGIREGMVGIGEFSEVIPEDIRAEAAALRDSIAAGEYHPFTGPLNRQDGTPWLAEGEVADDETLLGMDFLVEGIRTQLPSN